MKEQELDDGRELMLLDVVDVPLWEPVPEGCHTEDWTVAAGVWKRTGSLGWPELMPYVESPKSLWVDDRRTKTGYNDEMTAEQAGELRRSLYLVRVPSIALLATEKWGTSDEVDVWAKFHHAGVYYRFKVTDLTVKARMESMGAGTQIELGECCLCLSISEPLEKSSGEWCRYKLVAAVIERRQVRA